MKIKVPEGMLYAISKKPNWRALTSEGRIKLENGPLEELEAILETALQWISDNPSPPVEKKEPDLPQCWMCEQRFPFPKLSQIDTISLHLFCFDCQKSIRELRRSKQAPESKAVNDLLVETNSHHWADAVGGRTHNEDVLEAYRRGYHAGLDGVFPPRTKGDANGSH